MIPLSMQYKQFITCIVTWMFVAFEMRCQYVELCFLCYVFQTRKLNWTMQKAVNHWKHSLMMTIVRTFYMRLINVEVWCIQPKIKAFKNWICIYTLDLSIQTIFCPQEWPERKKKKRKKIYKCKIKKWMYYFHVCMYARV